MNENNYYLERDLKNQEKINEMLRNDLPSFCREFFIGIQNRTSLLTRLNYAYDLRLFFNYLCVEVPGFNGLSPKNLELQHLANLTSFDIEEYLGYINLYQKRNLNGKKVVVKNAEKGIARKLSSIRSLYKYFFKKDKITANVSSNVEFPKLHDKEIIRLQRDEIKELLDTAESGQGLSKRQLQLHKNSKTRDVAILTLLLGTGIRISECVGLDVDNIDFKNLSFVVTRKGGNRVELYFSDEVASALCDYYELRVADPDVSSEEKAVFLSKNKTRITPRAVQMLVKKYSQIVTPLKKITPHKLRSTYGTQLYRATKDIYVVAEVLGHKDVNTTKKHYAALSDDIKRKASTKIKLHDDDNNE